jgi:hypothetical protein
MLLITTKIHNQLIILILIRNLIYFLSKKKEKHLDLALIIKT